MKYSSLHSISLQPFQTGAGHIVNCVKNEGQICPSRGFQKELRRRKRRLWRFPALQAVPGKADFAYRPDCIAVLLDPPTERFCLPQRRLPLLPLPIPLRMQAGGRKDLARSALRDLQNLIQRIAIHGWGHNRLQPLGKPACQQAVPAFWRQLVQMVVGFNHSFIGAAFSAAYPAVNKRLPR